MALALGTILSAWQISAVHDQGQAPLRAQALTAAVSAAGDAHRNNQDNLAAGLAATVPTTSRGATTKAATGSAAAGNAPRRAAPGARAATTGFVRGAYGTDSSDSGYSLIAGAGFNAIMGSHYREELDAVAALGLQAVVWLGSWSNSSCSFAWDDSHVESAITPVAGHPAIVAYYLGDEPLFSACPSAPDTYAARSALVHSLDPGRPTFTVVQSWDAGGRESFPYGHFAGAVDILGLDVYPCSHGRAECNFAEIDGAIAAAEAAGINYWGILQAFEDDYYRLPTSDEVAAQFERWQNSRMSGYFIFSWNYLGTGLDGYPDVVREFARWNLR